MNINGVYGNTIPQATSDKVIGTTIKSSQTTATENSAEALSSIPNNEFLTYDEKVNVKQETSSKEEKQSEEDSLKNSSESMTEEDYKDLSDEGISLEEYNIDRLERALERIKGQRVMNQETIENMKLKIEEKVQSIMNIKNVSGLTKRIVKKLMEAQMPVTESNILKLANAMEMAQTITQISDKSMVYLVKNNQKLTVENIYKAQYSGVYSSCKDITDETWKQLQAKVNNIITDAGLELNSENIGSAKWLLQNNLPVTEENVKTMYDLNSAKNGVDEDQLLNDMVITLSKGRGPESTSISTYIEDQVIRSIDAFQSISDEAVNYAIANHTEENVDEINLKILKQAQSEVNRIKAEENNEINELLSKEINNELNADIDIKSVIVRRQLEEIRLKLTVEAGGHLIKKGIHIETDSLSKVVEGLKEIEDAYYLNLLKEGEVQVNSFNIELLKNSITGIEELKGAPDYILGSTLSNRNIQTVNSLITEGNTVKQQLEKANESYEALMTKPRVDMGDSITKAFQNIDAILEDMNLDNTKSNQRAVRILGYNNINITAENINHVKAYDEQVNYMMKNFHPAVATHLIKSGLNPLNMPVEELNKCIDQVKSELGVTGEEKYSKFLYKLEKENGLTEEEKKSYIGIYRLLNNVEKTGGAALGSVLKADQEVTMNNLLTAVRTIRSGGVKVSVDDSYGALEALTYTRESITDQIASAFRSVNELEGNNTISSSETGNKALEFEYNKLLLKRMEEEITPHKLQTSGNLDDLMNMPMDKLADIIENQQDNSEIEHSYWSSKLQELKESIGNVDIALKLIKDYHLPANIQNTQCANDILNGDRSFYSQWKKQIEKVNDNSAGEVSNIDNSSLQSMSQNLLESLTSKSSMIEQYNRVEQNVNRVLNKLYENPVISSQEITTLQRISNGFSFLQKLAQRESYELPMVIGDKITNVNITFIRNTGESGKIDINIKSETLGNIKVDLQVKENGLKGLITCENRKALDLLLSGKESLENNISGSGVTVKNMNYGIISSRPESYQSKNFVVDENDKDTALVEEKTDTNLLYNIGKIVLTNIKTLEEVYENTYAV